MSEPRALVRNAADPKQVSFAGRKVKEARELELSDLRQVLQTEAGRRFVWRALGYCQVFGDGFDESPHRTAFNAGVKNVGAFLMAEITSADEEAFFLMMRENRVRQQRQTTEAEAMQTASADQRRGETDEN